MSKQTDTLLAEALCEKALLKREEIEGLLREADNARCGLKQLLSERGIIPEASLIQLLAAKFNLPVVSIKDAVVDKVVVERIPVKIASYYRFCPLKIEDNVVTVASASPLDIKIQDEIRMQLGLDIAVMLAGEADVADAIRRIYGLGADTLEKMPPGGPGQDATGGSVAKIEDIGRLAEDASVIRIVNQIILDAYRKRATDIHIEPFRDALSLRYRVDGLLYDAHLPEEMRGYLNAIISRIKIMSNLNIVERRMPQDGRAVVKAQDQILDLRISTIPTPYGESIVIRILPAKMLFSLEKLGLARRQLQLFESFILKPHGIIFVTGPTGSGKTTTLYACLSRINTKERKIITIEDPIEYEMPGITQIQVHSEIGLDFARGLRSMLRHDPDVMMVGEVRDLETAEIAIRVALTGHLVFSTLHTNDAASGITRLIDIGLEPYLLSSSVEAFIAQRLVRLICDQCKFEDTKAPEELRSLIARDLALPSVSEVKIFRGKGCAACNSTGFFGRTAIYEILAVDDAIEELILRKASGRQINRQALLSGMRTLRQDGWQKVCAGLTTPEEVMKVTPAETTGEESQRVGGSAGQQVGGSAELPAGAEKRVFKRLDGTVNVRYRVIKSQGELLAYGFDPEHLSVSKNVSAGGVLFISPEPLVVGSILEMVIELPDGELPVQSHARVVRTEETAREGCFDVAVYFLDLTGAHRVRIDKYAEET